MWPELSGSLSEADEAAPPFPMGLLVPSLPLKKAPDEPGHFVAAPLQEEPEGLGVDPESVTHPESAAALLGGRSSEEELGLAPTSPSASEPGGGIHIHHLQPRRVGEPVTTPGPGASGGTQGFPHEIGKNGEGDSRTREFQALPMIEAHPYPHNQ